MKIQKLLNNKIIIGYNPLKNEVDYNFITFKTKPEKHFVVPNNKNANPFSLAISFSEKFKNEDVVILIPGKLFDTHGTRHGRGGGWYDRFLSHVPPDWNRVGVLHISQFSIYKLERQPWDEPVDWIMIYDGFSWSLQETLARHY